MPTFFYSVINKHCSCRQIDGNPTNIGRFYRRYIEKLQNQKSTEALNDFFKDDKSSEYPKYNGGIYRTCCRNRFQSLPIERMHDTTKNRIYCSIDNSGSDTEKLVPGYRIGFPVSDRVIPPTVDIKGQLSDDF